MRKAIALAKQAESIDEVPVGAIVVANETIIGQGYNRCITDCDPTAHAEIVAIRDACNYVNNYRMIDASLFVTLEPCAMCAGMLVHARITRVVFGAYDLKAGACGSVMDLSNHERLNHKFEVVSGVLETECSELLSTFFANKRAIKKRRKQQT